MDPALNELIQEIRTSDGFQVWVMEKAIQGNIVFHYEEHAVYAYIYELSRSSPSQALPGQPNDLGMFLGPHRVAAKCARSPPHLFQILTFRVAVSIPPVVARPSSVLSSSPSMSPSATSIPNPAVSAVRTPVERWQTILAAPWRQAHEPEPVGHNRRPILMDWLEDTSLPDSTQRTWMCQVPSALDITQPCGRTFTRWDRGLTHIRSQHLDFRPFPCGGLGNCKVSNW
jgi:hypothetical protein